MKTVAVLTRLLPTINAVRGSGAFNVVIATQAPKVAEDLRKAANDDRIVVTPLLGALDSLANAKMFEDQQTSMQLVGHLADQLLGDIAAGNVEHAQVVASSVDDITQRISTAVAAMRDVFQPDHQELRKIRADASELSALVDAEVGEGTRDAAQAVLAAQIYDAADRLVDDSYAERQRSLQAISGYAGRIAA